MLALPLLCNSTELHVFSPRLTTVQYLSPEGNRAGVCPFGDMLCISFDSELELQDVLKTPTVLSDHL